MNKIVFFFCPLTVNNDKCKNKHMAKKNTLFNQNVNHPYSISRIRRELYAYHKYIYTRFIRFRTFSKHQKIYFIKSLWNSLGLNVYECLLFRIKLLDDGSSTGYAHTRIRFFLVSFFFFCCCSSNKLKPKLFDLSDFAHNNRERLFNSIGWFFAFALLKRRAFFQQKQYCEFVNKTEQNRTEQHTHHT